MVITAPDFSMALRLHRATDWHFDPSLLLTQPSASRSSDYSPLFPALFTSSSNNLRIGSRFSTSLAPPKTGNAAYSANAVFWDRLLFWDRHPFSIAAYAKPFRTVCIVQLHSVSSRSTSAHPRLELGAGDTL
jgi:hypothetical protein